MMQCLSPVQMEEFCNKFQSVMLDMGVIHNVYENQLHRMLDLSELKHHKDEIRSIQISEKPSFFRPGTSTSPRLRIPCFSRFPGRARVARFPLSLRERITIRMRSARDRFSEKLHFRLKRARERSASARIRLFSKRNLHPGSSLSISPLSSPPRVDSPKLIVTSKSTETTAYAIPHIKDEGVHIHTLASSPLRGLFMPQHAILHITNPFFVPIGPLRNSLIRAVHRGVQVEILMA
jgi:hypothetical protein